ncbi:MAG: aminopeptidase P N-terminal domain-containing protein, partial [Bacteroidales bacterium]
MFPKEVYWQRRKQLHEQLKSGLVLFPGNGESAMNYRDNTYRFRQDSSFLYFFGINKPGFYGICDLDSGEDILYGNDLELDDIIWMGALPGVHELAALAGVEKTGSLNSLGEVLKNALAKGRKVH